MYAEWNDYKEKYLLGKPPEIQEAEFPFWSKKAASEIDKATFERLKEASALDEHRGVVILCSCELAEYLRVINEYRGLQSVSVTGHSVSLDKRQVRADIREILLRHLGNTGLLYAGVY